MLFHLVHNFGSMVAIVGPIWGSVVVVCLCENKDVVSTTERILEDGSGAEVHIGIVAGGLVGG